MYTIYLSYLMIWHWSNRKRKRETSERNTKEKGVEGVETKSKSSRGQCLNGVWESMVLRVKTFSDQGQTRGRKMWLWVTVDIPFSSERDVTRAEVKGRHGELSHNHSLGYSWLTRYRGRSGRKQWLKIIQHKLSCQSIWSGCCDSQVPISYCFR